MTDAKKKAHEGAKRANDKCDARYWIARALENLPSLRDAILSWGSSFSAGLSNPAMVQLFIDKHEDLLRAALAQTEDELKLFRIKSACLDSAEQEVEELTSKKKPALLPEDVEEYANCFIREYLSTHPGFAPTQCDVLGSFHVDDARDFARLALADRKAAVEAYLAACEKAVEEQASRARELIGQHVPSESVRELLRQAVSRIEAAAKGGEVKPDEDPGDEPQTLGDA